MKKKLTQNALLQCLERAITEIPDTRNNNRTKFSIRDAIIIVLSVFFLHSGSLNGHLELLGKAQGKRNRRLFGIEKVPSANQIRNILDLIDPNYLCDAQDSMIFQMQRSGVLKQFWAGSEFGYLAAFDGTEFFRSKSISCSGCCQAEYADGTIDYHHRVLLSGLVHPTEDIFLPLTQEFIVRQDGVEKEDCELNAGYRWWKALRKRHPQMKLTILADDLFCKQPFMQKVLDDQRTNVIFACKPGSHKTTYEWINTARQGGDLGIKKTKRREGRLWFEETYEYANDVPLKDCDKSLKVGFVQVTTRDTSSGKVVGTQAFATNMRVSANNCQQVSSFGRKKWKIENEGNNTLKNLGYHLEHNYGHGKKNLAAIFVLLMLIAFMMHVILNLVNQEGFAVLRQANETLRSCVEALRGAFLLIGCRTWEQLYERALEGIDTS